MSEEKDCYLHKDTKTRLSCSSCSRPICPKCAIPAAIGYICPECAKSKEPPKPAVSKAAYLNAFVMATLAGVLLGFLWNSVKPFGAFLLLASSYLVGFAIARIITSVTGFNSDKKLSIITGCITVLSIVYNPVLIWYLLGDMNILSIILMFTISYVSNIINTIAIIIAVWASVRHLRF